MRLRRPEITGSEEQRAINCVTTKLTYRLHQKGRGTYSSIHEILGIITEEYNELISAVQKNNHAEIVEELADIAVGCIFGIASINSKKVDW